MARSKRPHKASPKTPSRVKKRTVRKRRGRGLAHAHQHPELIGLCLYALGGCIDFAYRMTWGAPRASIWYSNLPVAFSAAVFWPVDLVAMALLANL